MKKTLVSAITSALVIGAASTTFAAANPFSDVPVGHWAYDAVEKLTSSGVIEGYGDNTYRGERSITRYEMAQMIAKAMAKVNTGKVTSTGDKALIDRLAAEFSDELNNLGVRVSKLEKNADMVKWTGELRYQYHSDRLENANGGTDKSNRNRLQLRLFPTAEVNDHWHVKARITAGNNMKRDNGTFGSSDDDKSKLELTYAFAEGDYKNFNVKLGKMPLYSVADDGLVVDDFFSGAQLTFGNKVKLTLEGGRFDLDRTAAANRLGVNTNYTATYWGAEVNGNLNKLNLGAAYRQFRNKEGFRALGRLDGDFRDNRDKMSIWSVGAGYKFDRNVGLKGAYARNTDADKFRDGYNIEVDYKGADYKNAHTWGAYFAYRKVGDYAGVVPTYDTFGRTSNKKGWEVGVGYVPFKNVLAQVAYFDGKQLEEKNHDKARTIYARISAFF